MDNEIQKHLFGLLTEFDRLCKRNGIAYVLANHSAWDAKKFGKYHGNMYQTTVMLTNHEFDKLTNIRLPPARRLVPFNTNGCDFLYADTSSFFVHYEAHIDKRNPYPGIEIVVAKQIANRTEYRVMNPNGKHFNLAKSLLTAKSVLTLEGVAFNVCNNIDEYLAKLAGADWKTKNWPYKAYKKNVSMVFIQDVPPKQMMKLSIVKRSFNDDLIRRMNEYWSWYRLEYEPAEKKVTKYQLFLQRTEDRFNLWEKYYPMKAELIDMSTDASRMDDLEALLGDFLDSFWYWNDKLSPLSFDEEILQISQPFLAKQRGEKAASSAIERIPEEYRKQDIATILRERNIKHPALKLPTST